jgi:hypothetical protein
MKERLSDSTFALYQSRSSIYLEAHAPMRKIALTKCGEMLY